jgi:hypothetical protein
MGSALPHPDLSTVYRTESIQIRENAETLNQDQFLILDEH